MSRYKDADEILFELDNLESSNKLPQEWSSFDALKSGNSGDFPTIFVNLTDSQIPSSPEEIIKSMADYAGKSKVNISFNATSCSFVEPAFKPLSFESRYVRIEPAVQCASSWEPVYRPSFLERINIQSWPAFLAVTALIAACIFVFWSQF